VNQLVPIASATLPTLVAAAGERASMRFPEFFARRHRQPAHAPAYARAAEEFLAWRAEAGVPLIAAVQPVHVATWIEAGTREPAAASVKQRLAAVPPSVRLARQRPGRACESSRLGAATAVTSLSVRMFAVQRKNNFQSGIVQRVGREASEPTVSSLSARCWAGP
jgi:hypothetical protein